jgi:prephenate dehydrogenase
MKIGIIGTGLIGGSLALALKNIAGKYEVSCWNRDLKNSKKAKNLNAVDSFFENIEDLAIWSDVIFICTPLSTYSEISKKLAKVITKETIITDVGSVKEKPTNIIKSLLPTKFTSNFVPVHPIAGKELSGIDNADKNLFESKKIIICKPRNCKKAKKISQIWSDIKSEIEFLNAKKHDEIYGYVSHYIQLLSFELSSFFSKKEKSELPEFTRLMNSPKSMWNEIFNLNKENLKKIHKEFLSNVQKNLKLKIYPNSKSDVEQISYFFAITINNITPKDYLNYIGTGYKSFTYPINCYNDCNCYLTDKALEKIKIIINELKKIKI